MTKLERMNEELRKLIKPATMMGKGKKKISFSKELQMKSHFGGVPYFEDGDMWPQTSSGENLDFVFQVFNQEGVELPEDIKLIQFFANLSEPAWEHEDEGWEVRIFKKLNPSKIKMIEAPDELLEMDCSEVKFYPINSLPNREGVSRFISEELEKLVKKNKRGKGISYKECVTRCIGRDIQKDYQLSGYPQWLNYDATPSNHSELLFQLNFGMESFYLFRNTKTKDVEYVFQTK